MGLFSGLFDIEGKVKEAISGFLESEAEKNKLKATELWVMIKPTDVDFNFEIYVYKQISGEKPQFLRKATVKEVVDL